MSDVWAVHSLSNGELSSLRPSRRVPFFFRTESDAARYMSEHGLFDRNGAVAQKAAASIERNRAEKRNYLALLNDYQRARNMGVPKELLRVPYRVRYLDYPTKDSFLEWNVPTAVPVHKNREIGESVFVVKRRTMFAGSYPAVEKDAESIVFATESDAQGWLTDNGLTDGGEEAVAANQERLLTEYDAAKRAYDALNAWCDAAVSEGVNEEVLRRPEPPVQPRVSDAIPDISHIVVGVAMWDGK